MKNDNRRVRLGSLLLCLTGVLWLAGCNSSFWYGETALEKDFGNSVHNNLAQTVINPKPSGLPAPGLSPTASVNSMERYEKTFKGEEKKPMGMTTSY